MEWQRIKGNKFALLGQTPLFITLPIIILEGSLAQKPGGKPEDFYADAVRSPKADPPGQPLTSHGAFTTFCSLTSYSYPRWF